MLAEASHTDTGDKRLLGVGPIMPESSTNGRWLLLRPFPAGTRSYLLAIATISDKRRCDLESTEVCLFERRSFNIQTLEDKVRIVGIAKVDHHHHQSAFNNLQQRLRNATRLVFGQSFESASEVFIRFAEARPWCFSSGLSMSGANEGRSDWVGSSFR